MEEQTRVVLAWNYGHWEQWCRNNDIQPNSPSDRKSKNVIRVLHEGDLAHIVGLDPDTTKLIIYESGMKHNRAYDIAKAYLTARFPTVERHDEFGLLEYDLFRNPQAHDASASTHPPGQQDTSPESGGDPV